MEPDLEKRVKAFENVDHNMGIAGFQAYWRDNRESLAKLINDLIAALRRASLEGKP